jgi:superoxide dismutase, Fe-Mn family
MNTNNKISRKKFIANSAKAVAAASTAQLFSAPLLAGFGTPASYATSFEQSPLSYPYNALEPFIDATTMEIHYSKHAAAYCKNLKEAALAEKVDMTKPLEGVLAKISTYSAKMRNNAGGHYNHELFWKSMKANGEGKPSGSLLAAIESNFNSFDAFKTQFAEAGKNRFGSGWAWLILDRNKKLIVGSTPNQDNPLMDLPISPSPALQHGKAGQAGIAELKGFPIVGLDVWEHAYYLKYQNRRADYIENWWKLVNWEFLQQRYEFSLMR